MCGCAQDNVPVYQDTNLPIVEDVTDLRLETGDWRLSLKFHPA